MKREIFVWVVLEEVILQVWHDKFFESLGNSWGHFVHFDASTMNRTRLDVARLFIRVGSSLNIPFSVSMMVGGSLHKILVEVEESMVVDVAEGASGGAIEEMTALCSLEADNVRLSLTPCGDLDAFAELDFGSHLAYEFHYADLGFCSTLSESEMIGGIAHAWAFAPLECLEMDSKGMCCEAANSNISNQLEYEPGLGPFNVELVFGSDKEVCKDMDHIPCRLDAHCVSDKSEGSLCAVIKNSGMAGSSKAVKPSGRRRKKSTKHVAQLVYGDKASTVVTSDDSIADDDIEHRNSIIRNEAEVTWEVSQSLGISFDCDKDRLLEVFMDLEHEEMKGKKPSA